MTTSPSGFAAEKDRFGPCECGRCDDYQGPPPKEDSWFDRYINNAPTFVIVGLATIIIVVPVVIIWRTIR